MRNVINLWMVLKISTQMPMTGVPLIDTIKDSSLFAKVPLHWRPRASRFLVVFCAGAGATIFGSNLAKVLAFVSFLCVVTTSITIPVIFHVRVGQNSENSKCSHSGCAVLWFCAFLFQVAGTYAVSRQLLHN